MLTMLIVFDVVRLCAVVSTHMVLFGAALLSPPLPHPHPLSSTAFAHRTSLRSLSHCSLNWLLPLLFLRHLFLPLPGTDYRCTSHGRDAPRDAARRHDPPPLPPSFPPLFVFAVQRLCLALQPLTQLPPQRHYGTSAARVAAPDRAARCGQAFDAARCAGTPARSRLRPLRRAARRSQQA